MRCRAGARWLVLAMLLPSVGLAAGHSRVSRETGLHGSSKTYHYNAKLHRWAENRKPRPARSMLGPRRGRQAHHHLG